MFSINVLGLSVFSLRVKQGMFNEVLSSCNPPLSVTKYLQFAIKHVNSKYPKGSSKIIFDFLLLFSSNLIFPNYFLFEDE